MYTDGDLPAFPWNQSGEAGLTKREYFAALCMQALIAGNRGVSPDDRAQAAVENADALLAELAVPKS